MTTGLPASPTERENDAADWDARLRHAVETTRELSLETDPQRMVRQYARRMREYFPLDGHVSLSRRGLEFPKYRITRSHVFTDEINPWKEPDRLPLLEGGLLGELIYGDEPRMLDELSVSSDDPAYEHLAGMRSAIAIPHFTAGVALNMVVHMRKAPAAFSREGFPDLVMTSNLFGRATHNLVLSDQLRAAYEALDEELKVVADIQRSLLPVKLPAIPGLDLAAYYQTSRRAGGDYYDFFPLPEDKWGVLIADVSGHGTPAAVVMAITHAIAHSHPGPPTPPQSLLGYLNERLTSRPQYEASTFVTAFYGVYDPSTRELTYTCAGHPPPRLRSQGRIESLDAAQHLPLGVLPDEHYTQATHRLDPGDALLLYTDGIIETFNPARDLFGLQRLDRILSHHRGCAAGLVDEILREVTHFADGHPPADDRTLLVAQVI